MIFAIARIMPAFFLAFFLNANDSHSHSRPNANDSHSHLAAPKAPSSKSMKIKRAPRAPVVEVRKLVKSNIFKARGSADRSSLPTLYYTTSGRACQQLF